MLSSDDEAQRNVMALYYFRIDQQQESKDHDDHNGFFGGNHCSLSAVPAEVVGNANFRCDSHLPTLWSG